MNKTEKKLLKLIYFMASTALWSNENHCGSDMTEECFDNCRHKDKCLKGEKIDKLFKKIGIKI